MRSVFATTVVILLAACGSGSQPEPTPEPTAIASPTHPATAVVASTPATPVALAEIVFSTAIDPQTGGPAGIVTEMPENATTIYAFAQAGPLPAGATIAATWTLDGTPIPGVAQSVRVDHAREAGWIEFHLEWTAAGTWPRGTLGVSIGVNDETPITGSVQIVHA